MNNVECLMLKADVIVDIKQPSNFRSIVITLDSQQKKTVETQADWLYLKSISNNWKTLFIYLSDGNDFRLAVKNDSYKIRHGKLFSKVVLWNKGYEKTTVVLKPCLDNEEKQLHGACGWQASPIKTGSCLGEEAVSYLKRRDRAFTKNAAIVDAWEAVVPPTLQPFCRLDKRVGNALYLQAAPGPYMHQAQMLSGELLDRIKCLAPRCGIQKICVVPLRKNDKE